MITDMEGNPVAAIYLTPKAHMRIDLIKFFESLRQYLLFPHERESKEPKEEKCELGEGCIGPGCCGASHDSESGEK